MIDLIGTNEEVAKQVLAEHGGDGDDGFNDTLTRPLLYGVGGVTKDPARYAAICSIVVRMAYVPANHERIATFLVETANGLRRVGGVWDALQVTDTLETARTSILGLPEGPRRSRLEGLHAYHGGIVYRELGEFDKAALAQEESARLGSDPNTNGISRFCAAVEWAHYSLVVGDPAMIAEKLAALRAAVLALMALDGSNQEVRRWQLANCPAHLLYTHWLAGVKYYGWQAELEAFQRLPEDLAKTFEPWGLLFSAIDSLDRGGSGFPAVELADAVIKKDAHPSTTALAMLVAARAHQANRLLGITKVMLRAIVSLPGHGGHFVRAVAKRELEALASAKS